MKEKKLGRFFSTTCVPCSQNKARWCSLCRVFQHHSPAILVSHIPDIPLLCLGVLGAHHPAQDAPAQWAVAQISCVFRYFEVVFIARVSLRKPRISLKCSSDIASCLEGTSTGKCGPTALSTTWLEAWEHLDLAVSS